MGSPPTFGNYSAMGDCDVFSARAACVGLFGQDPIYALARVDVDGNPLDYSNGVW